MEIDTTFDFRIDAGGKDPDISSPTLRRYHQFLWSKPLPGGTFFALSITAPRVYLHHQSKVGEFFLSSDSVMPTFTRWVKMKPITEQFEEEENEAFRTIGYTIGGMMIFPSNQIDGKPTINAAKGFNSRISDRLDLTLECIRRHYDGTDSPLATTLLRYANFFSIFADFEGYVNYFLLDDLVTEDLFVKFLMPFDDFQLPSVPRDVETYRNFRTLSIEFTEARNARIRDFVSDKRASTA